MTNTDQLKIARTLRKQWLKQMRGNMRTKRDLQMTYDVLLDVTWSIIDMLHDDDPKFDQEKFREVVNQPMQCEVK